MKISLVDSARESVGQAWLKELSLVDVEGGNADAFAEACREILALNPSLGLDSKALYLTAQGWLAGQLAIQRRKLPFAPGQEAGLEITPGGQAGRDREFELMLGLLRGVFEVAYVHGKFDEKNGFNSCTSASDVVAAWMDENADLLVAPLDIGELMNRLRAEVTKMRGI